MNVLKFHYKTRPKSIADKWKKEILIKKSLVFMKFEN